MEIKIAARNMKLQEDERDYAEKKLGRLFKYLNSISSIKLELTEEKTKSRQPVFGAQVTVNVNGFLMRGEQKDENVRAAIDAVTDVMERLIDKFKKRYSTNKSKAHETIRTPAEEDVPQIEQSQYVYKRKRFIVKPMTAEQAVEQMDFLGHDFFLFVSDVDNSINVVYRRKDGKYGLIQPEFA
ncbi:MAG: ribosome-associated translation inhibitor RaiA [Chloroflexi bacterium]|nr:ribosome-associated translation inhibitor RaiA [Chloroflexota bacterium]